MIYKSPTQVAEFCRSLRTKKGLTQKELADALGENTKQSISNAECATDTSRIGVQARILSHFGRQLEPVFRVTRG